VSPYSEEDLLPISALSHLLFCERRAMLVHLEEAWRDNVYTVEGRNVHENAHEAGTCVEGNIRIARGLWLRSFQLGLVGKADVIEFHSGADMDDERHSVILSGAEGRWKPFPVEYKRGRRRHERGYEVQVCAQAMCLEEMLNVKVPCGALYYAATHRRLDLVFNENLRKETIAAAARLHELMQLGVTPEAIYGKKCESCSMIDVCLPENTGGGKSALQYLRLEMEKSGKTE